MLRDASRLSRSADLCRPRRVEQAPALFLEVPKARHCEGSDFPSLSHWLMRLMFMASPLSPTKSMRLMADVFVGFLGCTTLPPNGSEHWADATAVVGGLLLDEAATPEQGGWFRRHASACSEDTVRAAVAAARTAVASGEFVAMD